MGSTERQRDATVSLVGAADSGAEAAAEDEWTWVSSDEANSAA